MKRTQTRKSEPTRTEYRIIDVTKWQALLARLVKHYGQEAGPVGEWAAKKKARDVLRVSQPTFWRLAHKQEGDVVSRAMMWRIEVALKSIDARLPKALAECVMSIAGLRLYTKIHVPWCRERCLRFETRKGPQWIVWKTQGFSPTLVRQRGSDRVGHRRWALNWTKAHMRADCPQTWDSGVAALQNAGATGIRLTVALTRIAEPLAEHQSSGCIERKWPQLTRPEKTDYLERAFAQELLLLPQPHSQARAYELAAEIPVQGS